jgi:hypothetical protein
MGNTHANLSVVAFTPTVKAIRSPSGSCLGYAQRAQRRWRGAWGYCPQSRAAFVSAVLHSGPNRCDACAKSISDPLAVFAFVLQSLPDHVKVYPTENYYYFRFTHNGRPYAGSIRLPPGERDQGRIEFGYYKDLTEWSDVMEGDVHMVLSAAQGVKVEQLMALPIGSGI